MKLYYMTDLETVEKYILPQRRIKLSTYDKVNDPFELTCADLGDKKERMVFKKLYAHFLKHHGFICTSPKYSHPLMWAHYANKHEGICLGLEVADDNVHQMDYRPERLKALLNLKANGYGITDEMLTTVLTTKYEAWAYEDERRIFGRLKDPDARGFYYLNFEDDFQLREVIVGAKCKRTVRQMAGQVKGIQTAVNVWQVRPAFQSFTMVQQKRVTPVLVKAAKGHA